MAQSFCSRYIEENETLSCLQISVFKLSGTISAVWENQQAENLCLKCREAFITVSSFESVWFFSLWWLSPCWKWHTHRSHIQSCGATGGRALPSWCINCGFFLNAFNIFSLLSINCLRLLATPWNLLVFWQRLLHARQALYCRATSPAPCISLLWF